MALSTDLRTWHWVLDKIEGRTLGPCPVCGCRVSLGLFFYGLGGRVVCSEACHETDMLGSGDGGDLLVAIAEGGSARVRAGLDAQEADIELELVETSVKQSLVMMHHNRIVHDAALERALRGLAHRAARGR